jgi:hypothetical protein
LAKDEQKWERGKKKQRRRRKRGQGDRRERRWID